MKEQAQQRRLIILILLILDLHLHITEGNSSFCGRENQPPESEFGGTNNGMFTDAFYMLQHYILSYTTKKVGALQRTRFILAHLKRGSWGFCQYPVLQVTMSWWLAQQTGIVSCLNCCLKLQLQVALPDFPSFSPAAASSGAVTHWRPYVKEHTAVRKALAAIVVLLFFLGFQSSVSKESGSSVETHPNSSKYCHI